MSEPTKRHHQDERNDKEPGASGATSPLEF